MFGLVKLDFCDFFEFSVSSTRGYAYKLYKQRCASVRTDFLPAEWLISGTVSLILSVLLVCLPLNGLFEWSILVTFNRVRDITLGQLLVPLFCNHVVHLS